LRRRLIELRYGPARSDVSPRPARAYASRLIGGITAKVGLIICANHAIRAAVAAMRATFARILAEGGIAGIESSIASVAEIFTLQGDDRMRELERRFLP
jgi:hypothetical protein